MPTVAEYKKSKQKDNVTHVKETTYIERITQGLTKLKIDLRTDKRGKPNMKATIAKNSR